MGWEGQFLSGVRLPEILFIHRFWSFFPFFGSPKVIEVQKKLLQNNIKSSRSALGYHGIGYLYCIDYY